MEKSFTQELSNLPRFVDSISEKKVIYSLNLVRKGTVISLSDRVKNGKECLFSEKMGVIYPSDKDDSILCLVFNNCYSEKMVISNSTIINKSLKVICDSLLHTSDSNLVKIMLDTNAMIRPLILDTAIIYSVLTIQKKEAKNTQKIEVYFNDFYFDNAASIPQYIIELSILDLIYSFENYHQNLNIRGIKNELNWK